MIRNAVLFLLIAIVVSPVWGGEEFETDVIATSAGDVTMTFIGHGTLMLAVDGKIIHIDPFGHLADYDAMPDADLVLITHDHFDHFDVKSLEKIRKKTTTVVLTKKCAEQVDGGTVMENGDTIEVAGIGIEAVPAYNIVHKRNNGRLFHPKGEGNGYVITIGDQRFYFAGDTENTPEMKALKGIDYAFLPMNLPYTMTPEMVADAAMAFKPRVLYPYHYGETDPTRVVELLEGQGEIEVRIRKMG